MSKRKLSPMEIVKRAEADGLWQLQDEWDGESQFHKNTKGQLWHEFIREIQSQFVTEVAEDEDYLGNKLNQNKDE
jgi:hypothetical protein